MGVAVDITERKDAEEHLRAQERRAAVGQLAGGIAHDFNNILTSILLYAHVLRRNPHLPEDMAPGLNTIVEEARRAKCQILFTAIGQVVERNRFHSPVATLCVPCATVAEIADRAPADSWGPALDRVVFGAAQRDEDR